MAIPPTAFAASAEQTSADRPLTVGDIMSRRVVTVSMDDTLAKVRELFTEFRFHHLLVLEERQLVGVISDRDLLKALSPNIGTLSETDRDRATLNKRAHQIMSRHPISVTTALPIKTAARLLIEKKVSCLPVVTENDRLEGIVSWKDILNALCPSVSPLP
ncbi:MAG: CBS domain-containing protein [Nitrospirota bacterium]